MGSEIKWYFVYHTFNGLVYPQKWWGVVTVGGKEMETNQKIEITEEEFKMSIRELERKYPYKEIP